MLATPRRVVEVAVPVRLDSGELHTFTGWRVQHSFSGGPGKGRGIRFHPKLDDIQILSTITRAFNEALVFASDHEVSLRDAAHALAIDRVCRIHSMRGLYP